MPRAGKNGPSWLDTIASSNRLNPVLPSAQIGSLRTEKKPTVRLAGKVQKIGKDVGASEKVEIAVEGANDLYKEIRIENTLEDSEGRRYDLKKVPK